MNLGQPTCCQYTGMVSSSAANNADRTEKLGITLPISLLKQIDNKRGDISRSTYVRRAIKNYLKLKESESKHATS